MNTPLYIQQTKEVVISHVDALKNKGAAMLIVLLLAADPVDTDAHIDNTFHPQMEEYMKQQVATPIDKLKQGLTQEEQQLADYLMTIIPQQYKAIVEETINEGLSKYGSNPDIKKILLMCLSNIAQHVPNTTYKDQYSTKNTPLLSQNNGQNGAIFNEIGYLYSIKEIDLEEKLDEEYEKKLQQELAQQKETLAQQKQELSLLLKSTGNITLEEALEKEKKAYEKLGKIFDQALQNNTLKEIFFNDPKNMQSFMELYEKIRNTRQLPQSFHVVAQYIKQHNLIK